MPFTSVIPVGTIVPYAGPETTALAAEGWLPCDGRLLARTDNAPLFAAIGTAYGAPTSTQFNVPDLRGVFLRGVQGDAPARTPGGDPNAAQRVSLKAGGASGNAVGSYQSNATARPHSSFRAAIASGNMTEKSVQGGGSTVVTRSNTDARDMSVSGGGDLETRPVNAYVNYIIKSHDPPVSPAEAPIGALMAFAGVDPTNMQSSWKLCNGDVLSNRGVFAALFAAIGFSFGKQDDQQFYLPDFRGMFLRGVDGGARRDPQSAARTAPQPSLPEGQRGNSGDAVGSRQGQATALPIRGFSTSYPRLPYVYADNACQAAGWGVFRWNGNGRSLSQSESGGDSETRPVNVSVDWYIRFN